MIWSAKQLSEIFGVNFALDAGEVQFNSKDVKSGDLFIALHGKTDGHLYVCDAINNGAAVAIVSKKIDLDSNKIIQVPDTMAALIKMAEYKRKKSKAKFIGITGSVGKTTTKEALKIMLAPFGNIFASRGNFNNYLGLLINLASMPDEIDYAIFEMGMNHAGEIRELTKIIKPHIAVITEIAPAHLEFFNSIEEIADAKCEIFESLQENGVAIINCDSPYYLRMRNKAIHHYSFGTSEDAQSRLKLYKNLGDKMRLEYEVNSVNLEVIMHNIPEHQAQNFAACFGVVENLGLDLKKATTFLNQFTLIDGRGSIVSVEKDNKNYKIICDYYNSNPQSLKAALKYLKQIEHENKVAIIGDMLELGPESSRYHKEMKPFIIDSGVNKIFFVGANVQDITDFPHNIKVGYFDNVAALISELDELLDGGELILLKGSNSIKLNKVFEYLKYLPQTLQ